MGPRPRASEADDGRPFEIEPPGSSQLPSGGLDIEESLAEFRELVSSAGAQIAAEIIQRRPRPDPATLIGAGKVEEIAGVAASTAG